MKRWNLNRGKLLRKTSRLGFSTKKKVHTKLLPSSQERTTKRALEGVRVCVCVDLERRE